MDETARIKLVTNEVPGKITICCLYVGRPLARLPDQKGKVDPRAFKTLSGAGFKTGGMQPRHLEGHVVLAFWDNLELQNTEGVHDEIELANAITIALQKQKKVSLKS